MVMPAQAAQAAQAGTEEPLLAALHVLTKRIHQSLDLKVTLDAVTTAVTEGLSFGVASVALNTSDGMIEIVSVAGEEGIRRGLLGMAFPRDSVASMLTDAERDGGLMYALRPLDSDGKLRRPDRPELAETDEWCPDEFLFAPLNTPDGEWLGNLAVDFPADGRRPGPQKRRMLEIFADHAAIAITHARMHEQLLDSQARLLYSATHDPLTGLGNRALLADVEVLDGSSQMPSVVLIVDLDNFKLINDSYGHHAGDEVLRVTAERLRDNIRQADLMIRTGGDEFLVVVKLPDADRVLPDLLARLGAVIRAPIRHAGAVYEVGASIGVAVCAARTPLDDALAAADADMYSAKRKQNASS